MHWASILVTAVQVAAGLVSDIIEMARAAGHPVDVTALTADLTAQVAARAGQVAATHAAVADILDDSPPPASRR